MKITPQAEQYGLPHKEAAELPPEEDFGSFFSGITAGTMRRASDEGLQPMGNPSAGVQRYLKSPHFMEWYEKGGHQHGAPHEALDAYLDHLGSDEPDSGGIMPGHIDPRDNF
jgi:hypothetical protein